jgi:hypothetical protein
MMKKLGILAGLLGLCGSLVASDCYPWEIEARGAAFRPWSHEAREIYNNWWGSGQLEFAKYFTCNRAWAVWGNVTVDTKSGESSLGDETRIYVVPASLGLRGTYWATPSVGLYLGVGGTYGWLRIHDHNEFVEEHVKKGGGGIIGKSGFKWLFSCHGLLDLFMDYSWQRFEFHNNEKLLRPHHVDLGGLYLGAALGVTW